MSTTSAFGQPRTGGLFGSSSTSTTPAAGSGGFGSTAAAPTSGGFGSTAPAPGSTLVGPANPGTSTSNRGLFGSTNSSAFGSANPGTSTSNRGLFSSANVSIAPPISSSVPPGASGANGSSGNLFSQGPFTHNQPAKTSSREPEAPKPPRKVEPFDPSSPVITVKVGTSATGTATFHVHQDILRRTSDFLRAKSKEVWSEPGRAVEIPNHSSAIFKLYVNWAYSGLINLAKKPEKSADTAQAQPDPKRVTVEAVTEGSQTEPESNSVTNDKSTEKSQTESGSKADTNDKSSETCQAETNSQSDTQEDDNIWTVLAKAYVLGEELMDANFQSDVLASLHHTRWSGDDTTIGPLVGELSNIIYDGTTEGSPARLFLVNLYSSQLTKAELAARKGTLAPDFVYDMLMENAPASR
ncbi:hypothetical protein CKM354_001079800 [Cercospora kikuchii]|uniref:BTB domain-containing protein n=1 Tax=Cercospora kikuchii TaxID=84275 RepID=A0A9P3CZK4_9PEZI|nr:uncharacterized protein CKM354_001079800 [Cercospora kikuchii]GIZ47713.1 hypothetical protein CKM354_001079800 [Cercospora kikuchii]